MARQATVTPGHPKRSRGGVPPWLRTAREFQLIDVNQTLRQNEILLTGGNGFLGKVILGLLLDRYPEFKHLHILLRPKQNLSAQDRFYREILQSPALASIAEKRGENFFRDKITVWSGDIGEPDCGIESSQLDRLVARVRLIINCAGRVDFFPAVDESFSSNVDGVENLLAVAKRLAAKLLHVSTCFVCGEADGLIEETEPVLGYYPRRKGPDDRTFRHDEEIRYCRQRIRQIYEGARTNGETAPPSQSKDVAQRLIALGKQRAEHWGWVNTYTYAKSLGEQVIAAEPDLECALVRPAIVESALRFPFPGWIEGGRTAAPLVLMALGGMKDWPARRDTPLEVVPVDLVASALLVVGALLLNGCHRPVYQLGTADSNPVLLGQLVTLLDAESRRRRSKNGNQPPGLGLMIRGRRARFVSAGEVRARRLRLQERIRRAEAFVAWMRKILDHASLPGRQRLAAWTTALRSLSLQATFREQTLEQYLPFILHNRYIFESENIRAAYSLISEEDRRLLPWDPQHIDWKAYWVLNQIEGIEKWVQPEAVREWTFRV